MNFLRIFIPAVGLLAFGTSAAAHEAHVHGVAHMNLLVEKQAVEIELVTPLANVLSFEHEPETEGQKQEVRDMAAIMRNAGKLFILPADAQCEVKEVSMSSEVISPELLSAEVEKEHQGSQEHNGHSHDGGPEHNEHSHDGGHEEEHGHSDLDVDIAFICRNPEKLDSINVGMFKAFPNLHEIEVQMVTPKGQSAAELTPDSAVIRW